MPLKDIFKFVQLLHEYRKVERMVLVQASDRMENDVEHSYTLAMLAWFIIDQYKLDLDLTKVLKYALVHDMVEVYAGDTFFYTTSAEQQATKHEREAAAAQKLKEKYPEFAELHELIASYEAKKDRESVFIYSLDKVEPMMSIYLDGGRTWRHCDITLEMLKSKKGPQVALDPTISKIFEEFVTTLKAEEQKLFVK